MDQFQIEQLLSSLSCCKVQIHLVRFRRKSCSRFKLQILLGTRLKFTNRGQGQGINKRIRNGIGQINLETIQWDHNIFLGNGCHVMVMNRKIAIFICIEKWITKNDRVQEILFRQRIFELIWSASLFMVLK